MTHKLNRRQFVSRFATTAAGVTAGLAASSIVGVPTIVKAAAADSSGKLIGQLAYDGEPPARKKLTVDKDVECCGKFDIRDESLMVGEDRGLANVFVYARSRSVPVLPAAAESIEKQVTLDNRDCIFLPHCMTVWCAEQEFRIVNSDPVAQNVAYSPLGDVPANIVIPVDGEATWKFRRAQTVPVPIACNYHPWESAYILPRDNPYVAITAADGTFTIENLPPGELEFQVWQERLGYLDTPQWPKGRFTLTVKPGTNDLGTVKLAPSLFEK